MNSPEKGAESVDSAFVQFHSTTVIMNSYRLRSLFCVAVFSLFALPAMATEWGEWNTFARCKAPDGSVLLVLEIRLMTSANYNACRAQWRLTNNTRAAMSDISIADKDYTLSNGMTISRSGERMRGTIESGGSVQTQSDPIYSDSTGVSVESVNLESPGITLAFYHNGKLMRMGWNELGTITR
jgi:hypothetical protein